MPDPDSPAARPDGRSPRPPATLDGWFALHQSFVLNRPALRRATPGSRYSAMSEAGEAIGAMGRLPPSEGWSLPVRLTGNSADMMLVHFRRTLEELGEAERRVKALDIAEWLRLERSFLSVTEAGLYHLTARLAREAEKRGGEPGDAEYLAELERGKRSELESAHVRRRLFPPIPDANSWVCFYPMSKRRAVGQNWYELDLEERSRLMYTHGLTGRRYAGRVRQVITGAIGLDDWEWGVTLFADDPLVFKELVTEMRFDEVSARYAEFGSFEVGRVVPTRELLASLIG